MYTLYGLNHEGLLNTILLVFLQNVQQIKHSKSFKVAHRLCIVLNLLSIRSYPYFEPVIIVYIISIMPLALSALFLTVQLRTFSYNSW